MATKVTPIRQNPSASPPPTPPKPVIRTAEGVRNLLFEEIDQLRAGTGDRRRAATIAQLVAQVINVTKVEIDYQRHLALIGRESKVEAENEARRLGVLRLGSEPLP